MNTFSYPDPRTAFIFNHPNLTQDTVNCICFMSRELETMPSVISMKISRVNPCLEDCTGLFTFKGIHIFGSAGASTIQYHLKTGAQLGFSDCRQWVPPTLSVCSWGVQQARELPPCKEQLNRQCSTTLEHTWKSTIT